MKILVSVAACVMLAGCGGDAVLSSGGIQDAGTVLSGPADAAVADTTAAGAEKPAETIDAAAAILS